MCDSFASESQESLKKNGAVICEQDSRDRAFVEDPYGPDRRPTRRDPPISGGHPDGAATRPRIVPRRVRCTRGRKRGDTGVAVSKILFYFM